MRRAALVLGCALLPISACAPPAKPVRPAPELDCSLGFETLSARIAAEPGIKRVQEPGEPFAYYNTADDQTSYMVTAPGAPGHPAILKQEVVAGGDLRNSGCPYGDAKGYDQLVAYLAALAKARAR